MKKFCLLFFVAAVALWNAQLLHGEPRAAGCGPWADQGFCAMGAEHGADTIGRGHKGGNKSLCDSVDGLAFGGLTDSSFTVSWHERGTATAWVVEYGAGPFAPGCGQGITMSVSDTVCTIAGLSSGVLYQVYVHADCGGGDTSTNTNGFIRTLCLLGPQDLPYSYGFESSNSSDPGQGGLDGYNRRHPCVLLHGQASMRRTDNYPNYERRSNGLWYVVLSGWTEFGGRDNGMVVFPAYSGDASTLMVRFRARGISPTDGHLSVGVLEDLEDLSTATRLTRVTVSGDQYWAYHTVALRNYAGSGHYVFIEADSLEGNLHVDDLELDVAPLCPPLLGLEARKAGSAAVHLSWDIPQGYTSEPDGYDVLYSDSRGYHSTTVSERNALIEGLLPGEEYTFSVTADCVASLGETDSVQLRTECLSGGRTRHAGEHDTLMLRGLVPMPVEWMFDNSFSQTIIPRAKLVEMGLVPGNIYGCTYKMHELSNGISSQPQNTTVLIYLDSTERSNYSGARADEWCPIDSTKRYYKGVRWARLNPDGDERYDFDRPFVWNGHSNLVITMMTNRMPSTPPDQRADPNYLGYSVETTDSVTMATVKDSAAFAEDTVPTTRRIRYALMPNLTLYGDCDTVESCGRPLVVVDSASSTTVRIHWAPGWHESDWRVEHCDTSGQWVTDAASVRVPEYTLTGLPPHTECTIRVTGNCNDGREHWDTVRVATGCMPAGLPLREDFDTWGAGVAVSSIAPCWYRKSSIDGTNIHHPYVSNSRCYSQGNALCVNSGLDQWAYIAMPAVDVDVDSLQLSLSILSEDSTYGRSIEVGVMNNPMDMRTFTAVQTVRATKVNKWEEFDVRLDGYEGNGRYVALLSHGTMASRLYIDNLELDYYNPCPRMKGLEVTEATPTSVTLRWDDEDRGGTAVVEYGRGGFEPGRGTRVTATGDTLTIGGLESDSCYDFYVRRVCGAGDTSRYTGPLSLTAGAWNTRPMLHDTMRLCGMTLHDDGGRAGNYRAYQVSAVTLLPPDTTSVVMLQGSYSGRNGDLLAIYDGMEATGQVLERVTGEVVDLPIGPVVATNPSGALTVAFLAQGGNTAGGYSLEVSCLPTRPADCDAPTGLSNGELTPWTAAVSWDGPGTFDVMCIAVDDNHIPTYSRDTARVHTFTPLASGTTYNWYVRRVCSDNLSPWSQGTFTTPQAPCSKPVLLSKSHLGAYGVTIDWEAASAQSSWELRIEGDTVIDTIVYAHPVRIESLSPATEYSCAVRSLCSDGGISNWTSTLRFTTLEPEGVEEPAGMPATAVRIYPNPTREGRQAVVAVTGAEDGATVTLYDLSGRCLQKHRQQCRERCEISLDLKGLPKGAYFVKVQTGSYVVVKKVIIN